MKRLILSDHQGEPITLIGTNAGLAVQVARQRAVRNWYYKHTNLHFAYAPLLYVEVEYKQTVMLLDTRHICVRFFAASNQAEHEAVAEADAAVLYVKAHPNDPHNVGRLAYADEVIWLAVTGHLANVPDKPVTKNRMFRGTATWNEYEPVDPRLLA